MARLSIVALLVAIFLTGFVAANPAPQVCGGHRCAQLVHGGAWCAKNRDGSERCSYACNNGYRLVTTDGTHCRKMKSGDVDQHHHEPPHDGGWQPPHDGGDHPPHDGDHPPHDGGDHPPHDGGDHPPHGGGWQPPPDNSHHGGDHGHGWDGKCSGNTCAKLVHGYAQCQNAPDGTARCGYVCDNGYYLEATGHSNHCRPKPKKQGGGGGHRD